MLLSLGVCAGCGLEWRGSADAYPAEDVEILVDQSGVPHVFAKSDTDAFFGAGYIQATHRLYQMDIARRRAHGRVAEVLGAGSVGDDKLARLFGWRALGQRIAELTEQLNPEEWSVLEAWAAGVNQRVDEVLASEVPMPYGFAEHQFLPERWEPADPLIIATMTRFGNDATIDYEIFTTIGRMLYPEGFDAFELHRPAHDVFIVPPEDMPTTTRAGEPLSDALGSDALAQEPSATDVGKPLRFEMLSRLAAMRPGGSNNFAVDGRHTENGRPMLCGDPHQSFWFPGIFYALHINSADAGGSFDVAGFTFPGTAGVSLGQNRATAWTATTAFADVMDIFEVPAPDFETLLMGGQPVNVVVREEVVHVRDGEDETLELRDVPGVGVVLPDDIAPLPLAGPGNVLVAVWTGYRNDRPAELLDIDRADSVSQFEETIDKQFGLNFNLLAADAQTIGLRVGLDVPLRDLSTGLQPWLVQDGSNPAALWNGASLPRELLPRARAAVRGWIVTANNDPFGFTANGRVDDDPWYFGPLFAPGWRAKRISDEITRMMAAPAPITLADLLALEMDVHANHADDLLPLLAEAWSKIGSDPTLAAYANRPGLVTLADLLSTWDRQMTRDSAGALVFHVFEHQLTDVVLRDDMELMYDAVLELQPIFVLKIASLIVRGVFPRSAELLLEGRDVALLEALSRTAAFLEERFGGVDPSGYRWGDMHVSSFQNSLGEGIDFGETPSDGGESTVNVSSSTFAPGGMIADKWRSHGGPVFRMCFTFGDDGQPEMHFNFPLGNVADPASPHFNDLLPDWLEGNFRKMPFRRADVDASLEERIVLPAIE